VIRDGALETTTRSAAGSGSYTWNNTSTGVTVTHAVDGLGVEKWNYAQVYQYYDANNNLQTGTVAASASIDATAKAKLFNDATKIYDTVLDREMSVAERESLILSLTNGVLDKNSLATSLASNSEFTTRYGALSNAEYLQQLYLNSVERAPSLAELDRGLQILSSYSAWGHATVTAARAGIAVGLADSAEHEYLGNSHIATNNGQLDLSPPVFERILDSVMAKEQAALLIDTLFDRPATAYELERISQKILTGTQGLDDIVAEYRLITGQNADYQSATLVVPTFAELVTQVYRNAFDRAPSANELNRWTTYLSSSAITVDQFIVAVALSSDHQSEIRDLLPPASTAAAIVGDDNINSLTGGAAADTLIGKKGFDTLNGGAGSDRYVWTKLDGNDLISDSSTNQAEEDRLVLTDVLPNEVQLKWTGTNDLLVIIGTETLTINNRFYSSSTGHGIESISFSNGVIWTLSDILKYTTATAANGVTTLSGTLLNDNLRGQAGADSISGNGGDDTFDGGAGADLLSDISGNDVYIWRKTEGNDVITDGTSVQSEVDTLKLLDVASSEVSLLRGTGSYDLMISINTMSAFITSQYQFLAGSTYYGLEKIVFSDGVVWTLPDIYANTKVQGSTTTATSETLYGLPYRDNLFGYAGDDFLYGDYGDDSLTGGTTGPFADQLFGGNGSDTYFWSRGDGYDLVYESISSASDIDSLVLTDVASTEAWLVRANDSNNLQVRMGPDTIMIVDMFAGPTSGYGIEKIVFSDGVVWSLSDILDRTKVNASVGGILYGTNFQDNLYGSTGAETLYGYDGHDLLSGGTGNDILDGGNGNDLYLWSSGDGSDTISDSGASLQEVDTLDLQNIFYANVTLSKSVNDLLITIAGTSAPITVINRFWSANYGFGLELIKYSDGITTEILASAVGEITTTGTTANNTLNGWAFRDNMYGLGGDDILISGQGDDVLVGGDGADTLYGSIGRDRYIYASTDGSDIIEDSGTVLAETDTLEFTDINSGALVLTREGNDIKVTLTTTATITIKSMFYGTYGIERFEFADGTTWYRTDIFEATRYNGTTGDDSLVGTAFLDNIYGLDGNDSISGGAGNDTLVGGKGTDALDGGDGSDRYVWTKFDTGTTGDTIYDTSTSLIEDDRLVLTDTLSSEVQLKRINGSNDLKVITGTETLTITNRFYALTTGYGIESIAFSDGTIWSLADILSRTIVTPTIVGGTVDGTQMIDNLVGDTGNNTLSGLGDNDSLDGGKGVDNLRGADGDDTYIWRKLDGNDIILDQSGLGQELDTLKLVDVASSDVALTRATGSDHLTIKIISTGEIITDQYRFYGVLNSYYYGLDKIVFSDGVIWNLSDIYDKTKVEGDAGNNTLQGTIWRDNLYGYAGNDTLNGGDGDDLISGGTGADTMDGGAGVDTMTYATSIVGVSVNLASASAQTGSATGEQFGDVLTNIENIIGSAFTDSLTGNASANIIRAGVGFDIVIGGAGYDQLYGEDGNDTISGEDDSDDLYGGAGNDTINGGAGVSDLLVGGTGNDLLTGGTGGDVFLFALGDGKDAITDFECGLLGADAIQLNLGTAFDSFSEVMAVTAQVGADTVITFSTADTITLKNIVMTALVADDFLFP
jgi:Ca2+-binding RTX toxin-like protein